MKLFYCLLFGILLLTPQQAWAQDGPETITVTDLLKIQQLGSVQASPDGRSIAYAIRGIVDMGDEEYAYRSQLWILHAHLSANPRQLTFDEAGASDPAWHPDGNRVAFVRENDGKPQIFEISIFGGEAQQITDFDHGAASPQWAPDGSRLLFTATLSQSELAEQTGRAPRWQIERPGRSATAPAASEADPDGSLAEIRAWLDENSSDQDPRLFTRLNLQGELDLAPEPKFQHYFLLDITREASEPRMVTRGFTSYSGATWLPDSRQLVLSGYPEDIGHPDRELDRNLYLIDVQARTTKKLLDIDGYRLSAPQISPGGNHISFLARDLADPGYAQNELGIFALDGRSTPELLTMTFDRSLSQARWSEDNWFLLFTAPSDGGFPLFRIAVHQDKPALPTLSPEEQALADSLAADSLGQAARDTFAKGEISQRNPLVERLSSRASGVRSYDLTTGNIYYVRTEARNPYELCQATMEFRQNRCLTEHNAAWLKSKHISIPEPFTLQVDSLKIPYWVIRPARQIPGRRYPLLIQMHGGPSAMWGPGEATMWHEFQYMAAQGYGIVFSNPRGSGGYGYAHKRANYQDWGRGPADDVLAVADEAVRRHRWLDPARQVITGGSYAGYLTAWIIGQDHRFKAAVAQRGVYDLATFFGEGNAWRLVPSHFGGFPWEEGPLLRDNSPLTFVDAVRTPLLILHGDNDLRTGVIQSEVLYKSLKAREAPVEYIRYPNAGHDLSRTGNPRQRIDRLLRIYEFMERYVGE